MPAIRGPDGRFVGTENQPENLIQDKAQESDSLEIRILKRAIRDLKGKLQGLASGQTLITEAVKQSYEDPPDLSIPKPPKPSKKKHSEVAVLHLSDIHFGKVTSTYDTATAEIRLMDLAEKVLQITRVRQSSVAIKELRIYLGGDMIEGEEIFPHQAHLIDQSLFEQAVKTGPAALTKMVFKLLEGFEKIDILTVPGNHGRNGPKGNRAHPKTDWDNVCYEVMRIHLLGPDGTRSETRKRVTVTISDTFFIVDRVYDWGNLMVHGHEIRGGFAGLPWYGVARRAWGWIDSIPQPWDYLWFGHFHTYASATLNHRIFLANGSTESDNDYAAANMSACGHPCQRLCFFNEKVGLVSDNQVYLTDRGARMPARQRGYILKGL